MKNKLMISLFGLGLFAYSCGESTPEVSEEEQAEILSMEEQNEELGNDIETIKEKQAELDAAIAELDSLLAE